MTEKKKRLVPGQARVEYLANKQEIYEQLKQGYSLTSIYAKLIEENKITMSYKTLFTHVKGRASEFSEVLKKTPVKPRKKPTHAENTEENNLNVTEVAENLQKNNEDSEKKSTEHVNFLKSDSTFKKSENTDPNDLF